MKTIKEKKKGHQRLRWSRRLKRVPGEIAQWSVVYALLSVSSVWSWRLGLVSVEAHTSGPLEAAQ